MTTAWRLCATAAAVAAFMAISACGSDNPDANRAIAASQSRSPTKYAVPVKSDFTLAVKTLRKKCFDGAGCNIRYRVELSSKTRGPFDPDITYDITYKVTGADGTPVGALHLTGDSYFYDVDEESVTTSSARAVLRAVITGVEKQ